MFLIYFRTSTTSRADVNKAGREAKLSRTKVTQAVFWIWMDPAFFVDPDFKNLDPPIFCFNKLMGSKLCSLIRFLFCMNLTKKDSVESANYCTYSFWTFFSWILIRIFSGRVRIFWPIRIRALNTGPEGIHCCLLRNQRASLHQLFFNVLYCSA